MTATFLNLCSPLRPMPRSSGVLQGLQVMDCRATVEIWSSSLLTNSDMATLTEQ